MPVEVRFNKKDSIIEIIFPEKASHEEHVEARREAMNICRMYTARRLLIDMRKLSINHAVSNDDLYEFGSTWREEGATTDMRLACLPPAGPGDRVDVEFASDIAIHKGITSRNFEDHAEAVAWLMDEDL